MINNEKLKNYIQSANINFLVGSGLSMPYLSTLCNIETWLTQLYEEKLGDKETSIIEASLYRVYFNDVIKPNHQCHIEVDEELIGCYSLTIEHYLRFLNTWNEIMARRCSNILHKQMNIFSTNIDLFMESAAEQTRVEFNDGFRGRIAPKFDEGNFLKSYTKVSSHFQNTSELPVFNFFKIHGSVDWKSNKGGLDIFCDPKLNLISDIEASLGSIDSKWLINIDKDTTFETLITKANEIVEVNEDYSIDTFKIFFEEYDKLIIVNPTKRKFKETVLDLHFYELMRMYSNAIEKENSILFVQGFSFADEHIAQITLRAADTNPTLLIIVFAHDKEDVAKYYSRLKLHDGKSKNNNIWIISTDQYIQLNSEGKDDEYIAFLKKTFVNFDFKTINLVYESIGKMIPIRSYGK